MNYLKFEVSDFFRGSLSQVWLSGICGLCLGLWCLNSLRVCFIRFESEELGRTEF